MKTLNNYINEALIKKNSKIQIYKYCPKTYSELRAIVKERLSEDKNANLNDIDITNVTDMSQKNEDGCYGLFFRLDPHNIDISLWNTSNVEDMAFMFDSCQNFNCDLSKWDVSKVEDMSSMFSHCYKFEGIGLDKWKVSNVKHMYWMFEKCKNLNINLSNWKPFKVKDKVKDMKDMFDGCTSLKNIPDWYKE